LAPVLIGTFILLWCVRDFYVAGKGTLAPWSPPQHLVTIGLYRLVRNPMYVGVLTLVAGWALYFTSFLLGAYTLFLAIRFHLHVRGYEEPWLASEFGDEYERYKAAVPRWWPRLRPWQG
jgi:protein-S-isoprenylcysteine O-methyltransferase Ste14